MRKFVLINISYIMHTEHYNSSTLHYICVHIAKFIISTHKVSDYHHKYCMWFRVSLRFKVHLGHICNKINAEILLVEDKSSQVFVSNLSYSRTLDSYHPAQNCSRQLLYKQLY